MFSTSMQKGSKFEDEHCCTYIEGALDIMVLKAMLESGPKHGAYVRVRKFSQ